MLEATTDAFRGVIVDVRLRNILTVVLASKVRFRGEAEVAGKHNQLTRSKVTHHDISAGAFAVMHNAAFRTLYMVACNPRIEGST